MNRSRPGHSGFLGLSRRILKYRTARISLIESDEPVSPDLLLADISIVRSRISLSVSATEDFFRCLFCFVDMLVLREPFDHIGDTFRKQYFGNELQLFFHLRRVGDPYARIKLAFFGRTNGHFRRTAGFLDDRIEYVAKRLLLSDPHVDDLARKLRCLGGLEARIDRIVYVNKVAADRWVRNGHVNAFQRVPHSYRYQTSRTLKGTIDGKEPQRHGWRPAVQCGVLRQMRLCGFPYRIITVGPNYLIFTHLVVLGAIFRRRPRVHYHVDPSGPRGVEHIERGEQRCLQYLFGFGLERRIRAVDGHVIHDGRTDGFYDRGDRVTLAHVSRVQMELLFDVFEPPKVGGGADDAVDLRPLFDESPGEIGTDEPGDASDEHFHKRMVSYDPSVST